MKELCRPALSRVVVVFYGLSLDVSAVMYIYLPLYSVVFVLELTRLS